MLLITDPWQLPRASRAFSRQGLQVQPLAAEPQLSAPVHQTGQDWAYACTVMGY